MKARVKMGWIEAEPEEEIVEEDTQAEESEA
jgi:hypothetical protein